MGSAEKAGSHEDGGGSDSDEAEASAAGMDAGSCIVRRVVIDPTRCLVVDVPSRTATVLIGAGGEAAGAGVAGASFAVGLGRRLLGVETPEPAPAAGADGGISAV